MDKKSKIVRNIMIPLVVLIILMGSGYYYTLSRYLGGVDTVKITENAKELNIKPEAADKNTDVINIALFGIDTRANDYDGSRADTIMIATLDPVHKKIKLTSIMRDTFVSIPGEKYDKINHSYAYGGPELTVKTLNENFDMNIEDYITVNFSALEKIVNTIGGVEIDVKDYEIFEINESGSQAQVTKTGVQTLDGLQALEYSRIRYFGDGDFERTLRQRTVLENVINKVLNNKSLPQALSLIKTISPFIQTSFDQVELAGLATTVFAAGIATMEETRLPLDGHAVDGLWDSVYYLKPDTISENAAHLHQFIYEETGYVPSAGVEAISNEIINTF